MTEINLEEFEQKVVVRGLRLEDFDDLVALQERCFPGMLPWERGNVESQLKVFPEGQLVVEVDGRLAASSSSLIVDYGSYSEWHDYKKISDSGYIRNHDPNGDTLYGIEMMVDPEYRGFRLSRRLYDARKELARERNLARIMIGGRIPGYHRHADAMSAREYVEAVMHKALYDPVLTAQLANGFTLKRLIPDYMPSDEESRGYATWLEWTNLDHVPEKPRRWQAVQWVRICAVQYQVRTVKSFEEFATQAEFFMDVASDHQADFVVFPELFTAQLLSFLETTRPGLAVRKVAELVPSYLELFRGLAVKYNANVIGGSIFEVEDGSLYNASYLFRRDGTLETQRKLHVTESERRWWGLEGGPGLRVFATDRGRVAILLSTDIEHPEVARFAAHEGADLLFVPFATGERSAYLRVRTCAHARAIENEVYVAIAGCVGNLPFVENVDVHYAQSGVFTPSDLAFARDGIAAECDANVETVVICDLDLEVLRRQRKVGSSLNWSEPRDDLYRLQFRRDDDAWETVDLED